MSTDVTFRSTRLNPVNNMPEWRYQTCDMWHPSRGAWNQCLCAKRRDDRQKLAVTDGVRYQRLWAIATQAAAASFAVGPRYAPHLCVCAASQFCPHCGGRVLTL